MMHKLFKKLIYPFFFIVNHLGFKTFLPKRFRRIVDNFRSILIKLLGGKMGENVFFSKNFFSTNYNNLHLGSNGTIGMNCEFYSYEKIKIGDDFLIGSNVVIHTADHVYTDQTKSIIHQGSKYSEVSIGNNVYIGSNTIILLGVSMDDNIIIGAGSVVTKDLESEWIYGGNPAKKIKRFLYEK